MLLLVHFIRGYRGYYANPKDPGSRVEASFTQGWVALGASAGRAWLASPVLETEDVRFDSRDGSLRLVACARAASPTEIRDLSSVTLTFGSPRSSSSSCPPRDRPPRH